MSGVKKKYERQSRMPVFSMAKIFARAKRDGTGTVQVSAYPTQKELTKWRAAQKAFRFWSLAELITEAVNRMEIKAVPYNVVLDGKRAEQAEMMAEEYGYRDAEEWFQRSIEEHIDQAWKERAGWGEKSET